MLDVEFYLLQNLIPKDFEKKKEKKVKPRKPAQRTISNPLQRKATETRCAPTNQSTPPGPAVIPTFFTTKSLHHALQRVLTDAPPSTMPIPT